MVEKKENGRVEISAGGTSTILITDDGPFYGDTVTVFDADGKSLGKGELYVHNPLRITSVNGTAAHIYVEENQKIYKGSVICSLTDTDYTANYASLLKSRGELEDTLLDLVTIYNDGALLAPYNGSVSTVIYDENSTTSTTTTTTTTTTVMMGNMAQTTQASSTSSDLTKDIDIITLSPDKQMSASISVDESNILSLEIGQTAQVTISSVGEDVFEGTVTEINKTANSSNGVTRYTATITFDKTSQMLAGMKASVVVRIQGVDEAVIIPVEALHQTSSTSFVFTGYDETEGRFTGMVEVEAGIKNSSYVEIISGLNEGDKVYYTKEEESMFGRGRNGRRTGNSNYAGGMPEGDFNGGPPSAGNFNGGPPSGGNFDGGPPSGGNFYGPPTGGNF
jgi:Membrane-fusion protein